MRIYKHINEYKQEKQKGKITGEGSNYFSSRIVKKIAEDHIHQSLKQIQADNTTADGQFLASGASSTQSKSFDRLR